jgi:tRNA A37 threonylcarbamoyladenosine synthetase subunit TsaC/SUA5/YrdC
MLQNSESKERGKERQSNHQQLVEVIATLREEVRKLHTMPSEASQLLEQLLPVSLTWVCRMDAWNSRHNSRKS